MVANGSVIWREIHACRLQEFLAVGHRERRFFPHRVLCLPKPGPDGYKLAGRMCGETQPGRMWEIVLFADESMLGEFPTDLFFDPDLVWHQQHFGVAGHIAFADVVLAGSTLWSFAHTADVVQRIGRRREYKTRVEKRFQGWHDMLLNAVLAFALERGVEQILLPSAQLAMAHTDPSRTVGPEFFERIYDRDVNRLFRAEGVGDWWLLDVEANRERVVRPRVRAANLGSRKTICLCHDVEAGFGHVGLDDELVVLANRTWRRSLREMLTVERELGVQATYNVVGLLLPEVRDEIEAAGHCVAFHSYDHGEVEQLARCRGIDYRLKGYRPPKSRLTPELRAEHLLHHNFEWLASSAISLGSADPAARSGLVWIPVHFDDFPLYRSRSDLDAWEAAARERIAGHDVVVFSLHDCYAHLWLDRYPELLGKLRSLGELRTLDELTAAVTLVTAV